MSGKKQKIVIVGGGFAGVKAALELSKDDHFEIELITPHSRFEYHGAMYRSATGRSPLEVVVPMSEIFAGVKNVDIILDSIVELRPDSHDIEGESGRVYSYDTLIMGVGYVVNYFGIEGMALHAESMYSVSRAIRLRHRLVGAIRNQPKDTPLNIVVIGAGPTGVEIAADIQNFVKIVEGRHGLPAVNLDVTLVEGSDRVLPMLSSESSDIALKRLQEVGVNVKLNTQITKCNKDSIETATDSFHCDIPIWTAGNRANPLFEAYPDTFTLNKRGRVAVNDYFQSERANIYVIGDAADTTYSGMAQTAIHNAIHVAKNLTRAANNKRQQKYTPKLPAYVVPIGGEWALLETEDGVVAGDEGWQSRRDADMWVLENFLVYELAKKHHNYGNKIANF